MRSRLPSIHSGAWAVSFNILNSVPKRHTVAYKNPFCFFTCVLMHVIHFVNLRCNFLFSVPPISKDHGLTYLMSRNSYFKADGPVSKFYTASSITVSNCPCLKTERLSCLLIAWKTLYMCRRLL